MTHRRSSQSHLLGALTGVALGAAALAQTSVGHAQAFPFPSTNVGSGQTTDVLTSHELRAQYNFWRQTFVQACNEGGRRLVYPESNNDTRSEGVGYGMVIAAYFGDQQTFDGLWDYYQRFQQNGLMRWKTNGCAGSNDNGSAADADIDAAFGLIVANRQWPGQGYAADADTILDAIRGELFLGGCQGILLAGSDFADCGCTNPSYSAPGYYRAFASADTGQAAFWNNARTATYTYLLAAQNDQSGLVPAWASSNGGTGLSGGCTPQVSGGGSPNQFQADAARTPWRVATDLIWTGIPQAQQFLAPMANFAAGAPNRIVQIVDVYSLQGTPLNGNTNLNPATLDATGRRSTFTMGGFATAMAASTEDNIDRFTGAWQSMYLPGDSIDGNHAFNTSLALLYGLLVTGYMWDPTAGTPNPAPVAEPALVDQAGNLFDNGDFDEGFRGWTIENFNAGASEAFALHKGGELTVQIQEAEGEAAPWAIPLYQLVPITTGRNYLISFKARSTEVRAIRFALENLQNSMVPYATGSVGIDATMKSYEGVFTVAGSDQGARFAFQFGDSVAPVTLDDITLTETTRPVTPLAEVGGAPVPPVGGAGGAGGNDGQTGGDPGGGLGAGAGPTIPPGEGPIGAAGTGGGQTPGGTPLPGSVPGGQVSQPPLPTTQCSAAPTCTPCLYSQALNLCYDGNTGYVWNQATASFTAPPVTAACTPYVFWPKLQPAGACYDPMTGYAYNPGTCGTNPQACWVYVGANYELDTGGDDGGCSVVTTTKSGSTALLALFGFVTGAGIVARRRRAQRTA
jgi:endo-1,4-beta-D-glucanase Y